MDMEPGLAEAAQLFKVLGSESRLLLLRLLAAEPRTVGALTEATGMSQPLVSQHLRTLRQHAAAQHRIHIAVKACMHRRAILRHRLRRQLVHLR